MRLVDEDALKTRVMYADIAPEAKDAFFDMVDACRVSDAVPVVRCKECEHFVSQWKNDDGTTSGFCRMFNIADHPSNRFCSSGKRKDGGE